MKKTLLFDPITRKRMDRSNLSSPFLYLSPFLAVGVKEHLGAEVRPLNSREAEKYGLRATEGVAINWLEAKGPLQQAGLEIGDVILGIDDQPVQGMESFVQMASSLKTKQKISIVALDHRTGNQGVIQVVVR